MGKKNFAYHIIYIHIYAHTHMHTQFYLFIFKESVFKTDVYVNCTFSEML